MGGVLSLGSLACCFTSTACSAACAACPSVCHNGALTKVMYATILLLTVIVSCAMLLPGLQTLLAKFPFCEENVLSELVGVHVNIRCADAIGYLAVYRICFVVTLFFFLMALVTFGVKSGRDPRAPVHNGFWGLKYLIIIGGCIGAFFIPRGPFGAAWMYFGMVGGFIFILVQLVFIIDVAHLWAEEWRRNYVRSDDRRWFWALSAATVLMYIAAFVGIVLCYAYYTGLRVGDCKLHEFFITLNMILCVILSVTSVLPIVQEHQENSGLLQASFVTLYMVYLTWSAMSNQPDNLCKPDLTEIIMGTAPSTNESTIALTSFSRKPYDPELGPEMDTTSIFGLMIWFACVLYASIKTSDHSQAAKLTMTDTVTLTESEGGEEGRVSRETIAVDYNWSVFHLMFGLATLYVMMTLTNWYSPGKDVDLETISANMSAVWIKIISSWFCFGMYMLTLIAPILLPDRFAI